MTDGWLDHDPSRSEILAALGPLGPVRVLGEWPNDQPPPRRFRTWRTPEEERERRRHARQWQRRQRRSS